MTTELSPDRLDDLLPAGAATDVSLLALKLVDRLDTWVADRQEPFDRAHSGVYCLTSAFTTPWLDVDVLHLATKIWTWITAIDDAADEYFEDYDMLRRSVRRCRDVLGGAAPAPDDQLAVCLAEIRDDLTRQPLFAELGSLWRDSVERLMAAMLFERAAADSWRPGGAPPDLAQYLEKAYHTIGIPMYMIALWSTMEGQDLPEDRHALLPSLRHAALAVRLGNDLRSQAREKAGGTLNALALGMSPARLLDELRGHVAHSSRLLEPFSHLPSAIALDRVTTWCTRLYEKIDFRFPGAWVDDGTAT